MQYNLNEKFSKLACSHDSMHFTGVHTASGAMARRATRGCAERHRWSRPPRCRKPQASATEGARTRYETAASAT